MRNIKKNFSLPVLWKTINALADGKWSVFADEAGVPQSTFKQWLDGKAEPKRDNLKKLLNFTGLEEKDFYPEDEKETPANNLMYTSLPVNNEEYELIKALRELDLISRKGVYLSAITQLNEAMRERNIKKDKRKKEILEKTIKTLTKAIADI